MSKLAKYSTPILSRKLSAALGQRSHVQQVYLSGIFPSRAAFVRAARAELGRALEGALPASRIATIEVNDVEPDAVADLFVTPKDVFTVGSDSRRLADLLPTPQQP